MKRTGFSRLPISSPPAAPLPSLHNRAVPAFSGLLYQGLRKVIVCSPQISYLRRAGTQQDCGDGGRGVPSTGAQFGLFHLLTAGCGRTEHSGMCVFFLYLWSMRQNSVEPGFDIKNVLKLYGALARLVQLNARVSTNYINDFT